MFAVTTPRGTRLSGFLIWDKFLEAMAVAAHTQAPNFTPKKGLLENSVIGVFETREL